MHGLWYSTHTYRALHSPSELCVFGFAGTRFLDHLPHPPWRRLAQCRICQQFGPAPHTSGLVSQQLFPINLLVIYMGHPAAALTPYGTADWQHRSSIDHCQTMCTSSMLVAGSSGLFHSPAAVVQSSAHEQQFLSACSVVTLTNSAIYDSLPFA